MPEGDSLHRLAAQLQPLVGERVEASSPSPRGHATRRRACRRRPRARVRRGGRQASPAPLRGRRHRAEPSPHERALGRPGARPERAGAAAVARAPDAAFEAAQWNGPVLTARRRAHAAPRPRPARRRHSARGRGALLGPPTRDGCSATSSSTSASSSGIGNMWLAELLWQARALAVASGSARRDRRRARMPVGWGTARDARSGGTGRRSPRAVYRRAARPCPRCSSPIRSRGLGEANRTAYWCDSCQRGS